MYKIDLYLIEHKLTYVIINLKQVTHYFIFLDSAAELGTMYLLTQNFPVSTYTYNLHVDNDIPYKVQSTVVKNGSGKYIIITC